MPPKTTTMSEFQKVTKINENADLFCRACLSKVEEDYFYSFVWKDIKGLFSECTAIEVPDYEEVGFPQQLCSTCYDQCRGWRSFRDQCKKVDDLLHSRARNRAPVLPEFLPTIRLIRIDTVEHSDTESSSVGLGVEEEEDDEEEEEDKDKEDTDEEDEDEEEDKDEDDNDEDSGEESSAEGTGGEESTGGEEGTQCPVCQVIIPPYHLKQHLQKHYSKRNPKCPICPVKFTTTFSAIRHLMSKHRKGYVLRETPKPTAAGEMQVCPVCKEQTKQLIKHLLKSHYVRGQTKCPVCKKNFRYLYRHLVHHSGERPFVCGFCDLSFKEKYQRGQHWLKHHKDRESQWKKNENEVVPDKFIIECPKCHRMFRSRMDLHQHFVVHTNEKPYICNYCTISSRNKNFIQTHIRQCHPDKSEEEGVSIKEDSIFKRARPWEEMGYLVVARRQIGAPQLHICKVCTKRFSTEKYLLRHSVVHTKEKPFQCVYCFRRFSNRSNVIRHVKQKHPKKPLDDAVVLNEGTKFAKEYAKAAKKDDDWEKHLIGTKVFRASLSPIQEPVLVKDQGFSG